MNPFLKTLFSAIGGAALTAIAGTVDAAVQHPSGGLLTTIVSNPGYGVLYVAGAQFVHNLISNLEFIKKE